LDLDLKENNMLNVFGFNYSTIAPDKAKSSHQEPTPPLLQVESRLIFNDYDPAVCTLRFGISDMIYWNRKIRSSTSLGKSERSFCHWEKANTLSVCAY
jgi:hypothetical protein